MRLGETVMVLAGLGEDYPYRFTGAAADLTERQRALVAAARARELVEYQEKHKAASAESAAASARTPKAIAAAASKFATATNRAGLARFLAATARLQGVLVGLIAKALARGQADAAAALTAAHDRVADLARQAGGSAGQASRGVAKRRGARGLAGLGADLPVCPEYAPPGTTGCIPRVDLTVGTRLVSSTAVTPAVPPGMIMTPSGDFEPEAGPREPLPAEAYEWRRVVAGQSVPGQVQAFAFAMALSPGMPNYALAAQNVRMGQLDFQRYTDSAGQLQGKFLTPGADGRPESGQLRIEPILTGGLSALGDAAAWAWNQITDLASFLAHLAGLGCEALGNPEIRAAAGAVGGGATSALNSAISKLCEGGMPENEARTRLQSFVTFLGSLPPDLQGAQIFASITISAGGFSPTDDRHRSVQLAQTDVDGAKSGYKRLAKADLPVSTVKDTAYAIQKFLDTGAVAEPPGLLSGGILKLAIPAVVAVLVLR